MPNKNEDTDTRPAAQPMDPERLASLRKHVHHDREGWIAGAKLTEVEPACADSISWGLCGPAGLGGRVLDEDERQAIIDSLETVTARPAPEPGSCQPFIATYDDDGAVKDVVEVHPDARAFAGKL